MTSEAPDAAGAFEALSHAERLRRTTRRAARSIWFPLVLFGAATWGSAVVCTNDPYFGRSTNALNLYWLVAGPAAYLGSLWFYRRRERAVGVGEHPLPFVAAGLVLLLFTVSFVSIKQDGQGGATLTGFFRPGGYLDTLPAFAIAAVVAIVAYRFRKHGIAILAASVALCSLLFAADWMQLVLSYSYAMMYNTFPVIIAAIALLILAAIEKSPTLAVIAVLLGTAAGLSGIYWIANRFHGVPNCGGELGGMGAFVTAAGAIAFLVERRRAR